MSNTGYAIRHGHPRTRIAHGGKNDFMYDFRKKGADERNQRWQKLSAEQKLAELDERLGKGVGAKKQRVKLLNEIQNRNVKT